MAYLQVNNISKSFGSLQVLDDISFEMNKGEIVSLLGISGQGKTTLLRCINQLETFDQGTIKLDDQELDYKKDNQSKNFGLIFQNYNLFPQYNVLQNITLALNNNAKVRLKKEKMYFTKYRKMLKLEMEKNVNLARDILSKLNILDKEKSYPYELSGGQLQRVAIARALALKPNVLCFDEPTSALDPKSIKDIISIMNSLKKENQTIIIVTHDIGFAKTVSNRILFIQNGKIECDGTPKDLFSSNNTNPYWNEFLGSIEKE